jgi:hypothetical protein
MAQLITPNPNGDTPKVIEDKTRALPANQGLNNYDMWLKIDAEIAAARTANKINENVIYPPATTGNKHGNK